VSTPPAAEPLAFGTRPVAPEVAKPAQPAQLWNARPGLPIGAVFATEDGGAVVSIDEANHARLWPSIDGKREPFVLPTAMTREAVIARDGDGFAIAALDVSGGLELVAVDAAGKLLAHEKREPEPGVENVVAHGAGFLVLHRDQTLEQLDKRGKRVASLLPNPGEHVTKLLARNGRTLAFVRKRDGLRGRWLASEGLAWGDETPKLEVDLKRVALSPDHKRLLTFSDLDFQSRLVDLETGSSRVFAPDTTKGFEAPQGFPIGFHGNKLLFALNDFELSELQWWTLSGNAVGVVGGSNYALEFVDLAAPAVTDTNVIAFSGHEIAIMTMNTAGSPSKVRFLGYRTPRAKAVKSTPIGVVATIAGKASLLDNRVRTDQRVPALDTIPLAKDLALVRFTAADWGEKVQGVAPGIDPDWLEDPNAKPKTRATTTPRVALFDLATKKELQKWPAAKRLQFEPASQLMAMERGAKTIFATFDATTRTFGSEHTIVSGGSQVVLLDPSLAGGNVALLVRATRGSVEIRALRDVAAELPAPTTVTGTLEAVDRAGRVYVREDADTIVVHGGAEALRFTDISTAWKLRPSPRGNQVAAFGKSRLMLLDDHGRTVWSIGFPSISDVAWTTDGELIALANDIAKIDIADGRVIAAQCGWGFALRDARPEPQEFPSTSETLCDR
jgi:hypothetical protein